MTRNRRPHNVVRSNAKLLVPAGLILVLLSVVFFLLDMPMLGGIFAATGLTALIAVSIAQQKNVESLTADLWRQRHLLARLYDRTSEITSKLDEISDTATTAAKTSAQISKSQHELSSLSNRTYSDENILHSTKFQEDVTARLAALEQNVSSSWVRQATSLLRQSNGAPITFLGQKSTFIRVHDAVPMQLRHNLRLVDLESANLFRETMSSASWDNLIIETSEPLLAAIDSSRISKRMLRWLPRFSTVIQLTTGTKLIDEAVREKLAALNECDIFNDVIDDLANRWVVALDLTRD
ncbi:hypothetical protein [Gulosibacter sp. ACHW.36C]|uniref:Uncharacterized protein n=1 Tax=Gulosibacter sediminis TaxID=1729695 RepID=A0ABY4MXE7_9MICO|nr:hypothetical protein [Gulosibacter sediminis]UQN15096.1 hypothetical protein M3M28_01100 [Gulosibacter sediminis]